MDGQFSLINPVHILTKMYANKCETEYNTVVMFVIIWIIEDAPTAEE